MIYIQSIRSGRINEDSLIANSYRAMTTTYVNQLTNMVVTTGIKFDAVASAPSSRKDAVPYQERIMDTLRLKDISERFLKTKDVKSGASDTSLQDVIGAMKYNEKGDESSFKNLLIVDDSIASGSTVAAMFHHLKQAGLKDCTITVAVPVLFSSQ